MGYGPTVMTNSSPNARFAISNGNWAWASSSVTVSMAVSSITIHPLYCAALRAYVVSSVRSPLLPIFLLLGLRCGDRLALQLRHQVAQFRRAFEIQFLRSSQHLFVQFLKVFLGDVILRVQAGGF